MTQEKEYYKADSLESFNRQEEIYLLILKGYQRSRIVTYCNKKWGIKSGQVDKYIKKVRERIIEDTKEDREYKKAEIISKLEDLYLKNMEDENYIECRNVLKNQTDILGLNIHKEEDRTKTVTISFKEVNNE